MNFILILIGFAFGLGASYLAWRARMLDASGAIASTVLGTIVFGLGGWQWAVLLLVFFYTSSSLSKTFKARKVQYNADYAKGDRRDAGQVAANGAVAAAFVMLHLLEPGAAWPWIGFGGALAAANADTWATELGVLAGSRPRLITNLKRLVDTGASGGISLAGTLAALGGSLLIATGAALLSDSLDSRDVLAIAVGGLVGSIADSVLGATIQAMYYCPTDKRETEKHPLHSCGTPTKLVRGWRWVTNDWVNGACTGTGALLAWGLSVLIHAA